MYTAEEKAERKESFLKMSAKEFIGVMGIRRKQIGKYGNYKDSSIMDLILPGFAGYFYEFAEMSEARGLSSEIGRKFNEVGDLLMSGKDEVEGRAKKCAKAYRMLGTIKKLMEE